MKVLFIETSNMSPHLETTLELAKIHLDNGDYVDYYFVGHAVEYCENYINKKLSVFQWCLPERKGCTIIAAENFQFRGARKEDLPLNFECPPFANIEDLGNYKYQKYNAGLSTLSSLVSFLKTAYPDIQSNKKIINQIMKSGIWVYEYSLRLFKTMKPDLVYIFNGRFANNRAIIDAALETNTRYLIHERGADKGKYRIEPYLPHDFDKVKQEMLIKWHNNQTDASRKSIAESFFSRRRRGIEQDWKSFIQGQQKGLAFEGVRHQQKLITYFSSSDDEYVAVGEIVKWDHWKNQLQAVMELISIVGRHSSMVMAIRIHPHLAEKNPVDLNRWLQLDLPSNVYLIKPDDPIDSYTLIAQSAVVVTCGSTVGIESVFWGTPSICLGPNLYSNLDAVYLPTNNEELESLLLQDTLHAYQDRALPYGYYMSTYGKKFIHYEPETLFQGKFMGVNLQSFGVCCYIRKSMMLIYAIFRRVQKSL